MESRFNMLRWIAVTLFLLSGPALAGPAHPADIPGRYTGADGSYVSALDSVRVQRKGAWTEASFRYSAQQHLHTLENGASLQLTFDGTGIVILLDNHAAPEYGRDNLGMLEVTLDGRETLIINLQDSPLEIAPPLNGKAGKHRLFIVHKASSDGAGARITGFRVIDAPAGALEFTLHGEENRFLNDARAELYHSGELVRTTLVRNRLAGRCRLAGIPAGSGYSVIVRAMGWATAEVNGISVEKGRVTELAPIYLRRDKRAPNRRLTGYLVHWPRPGHPVARIPGAKFRVRVSCYRNEVAALVLKRREGPAEISRHLDFSELEELAYYYEREFTARIPETMPEGLYDLAVLIRDGDTGELRTTLSPRSVYLRSSFPDDPVFFTFGHLDTSGQYQAEYLRRMAEVANLIASDMVLVSNAVNPAYVSGALVELQMPYVINFGNHQVPGSRYWYGEAVDAVDFGDEFCVVNFGLQWHEDLSKVHSILAARDTTRIKVINAYEQNAPVEDILNRYGIAMLHDAHGTGQKVMEIGATPTVRVGKVNAESFRIVRFRNGRVVSCTYKGGKVAPWPFPRNGKAPLRVSFTPANDGLHTNVTARIINDFEEDIRRGRVVFVVPNDDYSIEGAKLESKTVSDDGKYAIMSVRTDFKAMQTTEVKVSILP